MKGINRVCYDVSSKPPATIEPIPELRSAYSKPKKVGNRTKDKSCWDSLYLTLKDRGYWVSNFWASTVGRLGHQGLRTVQGLALGGVLPRV